MPETSIGKYTIIEQPSYLKGCAFIGNYVHIRPHVRIGEGSEIRDYCFLAEGCKIGKDVRIMQYSNIGAGTIIGDQCFIGPGVLFCNDREITYPKENSWLKEPPVVGYRVRIGAGAIILPGVALADMCRIGAGSVVTKSTEPGVTYIGNPARVK